MIPKRPERDEYESMESWLMVRNEFNYAVAKELWEALEKIEESTAATWVQDFANEAMERVRESGWTP